MADLSLARRAVSAPGFRWLPGMLDDAGCRVLAVAGPWLFVVGVGCREAYQILASASLPDLHDDATRGALLALVREAWGDPSAHTELHPFGGWRCAAGPHLFRAEPTEAEALVAALEAAPVQR